MRRRTRPRSAGVDLSAPDPFGHFVKAQDGPYPSALAEIRAGRKSGHWMWFIFPQLASLGRSDMARYYGIADLDSAAAYLAHPVLGPRLIDISGALLACKGRRAESIFGPVDALKLRSCATLFAAVPGAPPVFGDLISAFYHGEICPFTANEIAS